MTKNQLQENQAAPPGKLSARHVPCRPRGTREHPLGMSKVGGTHFRSGDHLMRGETCSSVFDLAVASLSDLPVLHNR